MTSGLGAGALVAMFIAGLFIAALWVLLPFAVFGLKDLVRKAVAQQQHTAEILERIERTLASQQRDK